MIYNRKGDITVKTKKCVVFLVSIIFSIMFFYNISFAEFSDIKNNKYRLSITKMQELEILNGIEKDKFLPDSKVTREQFATIIIRTLDFQDNINNQKSVFPDVDTKRWSAGYINEAYTRNLITGKSDGLFYPEENITFGQVCTILVKTLGYNDLDGVWPSNYVNKANDLDITKDLKINSFDDVRRDELAQIINNFLNTKMKDSNMTVAEMYGIYIEDIVIGNSITIDSLKENQIVTVNHGILDNDSGKNNLNLGEKYDFVLENGVIVKIISLDNKVEKFNVINYKDGKISDKNGEILLSAKYTYYNNGYKINFDKLYEVLKINSSIIFLYDSKNELLVEAVTVIDPIYSKPIIVGNEEYTLKKEYPILKDGKYIKSNDIEDRDVIYKVDSYLNNSSYYEVVQNNVQGELTGISRNKVAAFSIEIDNVAYPISKYMPIEKLVKTSYGGYTVSDKVCAILGYDGKVIDLMDRGIKSGKYEKVRILGNSRSITTLEKNQVATEKGVYYVLDGLKELLVGVKYEVIIDGDTIVKVGNEERNQIGVTVRNIDDNKITYNEGRIMSLSKNTIYYYNGEILPFKDIGQTLKYNSSIIFIYNENETGYEYAIIIDPVYSKPEFVVGFDAYQKLNVGDISFSRDIPVIIDSETTDVYDIENETVMYKVSNYWGENEYLLILNTKISGTIEEFIPSRLNVNSIKINVNGQSKVYGFSEYFDINILTNNRELNQYKKGAVINVYLDKDEKIFNIR